MLVNTFLFLRRKFDKSLLSVVEKVLKSFKSFLSIVAVLAHKLLEAKEQG